MIRYLSMSYFAVSAHYTILYQLITLYQLCPLYPCLSSIDGVQSIGQISVVLSIVILAQRSAQYLCGWLTLVRDPKVVVTIQQKNYLKIVFIPYTIIRIIHFIQIMTYIFWSCRNRPDARAIQHCSTVWSWITPSTRVCSGFTAIHFRQKCSTEVIEWTPS